MTAIPLPDGIEQPDEERSAKRRWVPWLRLAIVAALPVAALTGLLGGQEARHSAESAEARLVIDSPATLRNGIFVEYRFEATARRDIADVVLSVPAAHWREVTVNTMIPEPAEQRSTPDEIRLFYGPLRAGETIAIKIDGQVNPPRRGSANGRYRLLDGNRELVSLPLRQRVLP